MNELEHYESMLAAVVIDCKIVDDRKVKQLYIDLLKDHIHNIHRMLVDDGHPVAHLDMYTGHFVK